MHFRPIFRFPSRWIFRFIGILFFGGVVHAQTFYCFPDTVSKDSLEMLRADWGQHKEIPDQIELQTLFALSFYPELKKVPIRFQLRDLKTTMAARPTLTSTFRDQNRSYIIFIDNYCANHCGILLEQVPFNAQIGLIGHELAHIKYYEQRNAFQVIGLAATYSLHKKKEAYEKLTDGMTIEQGLGWQLWQWSHFVHHESDADKSYKDYKARYYLKPEEIAAQIGILQEN